MIDYGKVLRDTKRGGVPGVYPIRLIDHRTLIRAIVVRSILRPTAMLWQRVGVGRQIPGVSNPLGQLLSGFNELALRVGEESQQE